MDYLSFFYSASVLCTCITMFMSRLRTSTAGDYEVLVPSGRSLLCHP